MLVTRSGCQFGRRVTSKVEVKVRERSVSSRLDSLLDEGGVHRIGGDLTGLEARFAGEKWTRSRLGLVRLGKELIQKQQD